MVDRGAASGAGLRVAVVGITPDNVHFLTYVRYLARRGHDVTVITNSSTVDAPVEVCSFARGGAMLRILPRGLRVLPRLARMRRCIRRDFDVLNIQQMTPDGVYAAFMWRGPLVLDFWGSDLYRLDRRPWLIRKLMPMAIRRATLIHSVSESMTRVLLGHGASADRIETFQYGIDLDVFGPGPVERRRPLIVSSRGLQPFYRVEILVRAMPTILARRPDARLEIAGTGDATPLRTVVVELGLEGSVMLCGTLSQEALAQRLREAQVWVSLPPSDGAPLSLLEAMASGAVPVVADIPAMREWLSDASGILIAEVTPEDVAQGVLAGLVRFGEADHMSVNLDAVRTQGDQAQNLPRWERMLYRAAETGGVR
jgi:glycosyltransferase involved in cell wall biosynthesis